MNDAPALKKANVGIAVAGATGAAKGAADIIFTEVCLRYNATIYYNAITAALATHDCKKQYGGSIHALTTCCRTCCAPDCIHTHRPDATIGALMEVLLCCTASSPAQCS